MRLNLGCGTDIRYGEEWINVDKHVPEGVQNHWDKKLGDIWVTERIGRTVEMGWFERLDITKAWHWDMESFDYILMDNVLEHIPPKYHTHVFQEAWRVLKPGGTWELIVPQGKQLVGSWDHVVPPSLLSRYRFEWLANEPYHADTVKRGYGFDLVSLDPAKSVWKRLREWWNWFDKANLEVVYEKVEG